MNRNPVINTPATGRTIAVVGDIYRFLATGAETDGKYALFEAIVGPGGGPPPHIHTREDESFYVLDGVVTINVDGKQVKATAGMFANIPEGTLHSFKNETDKPARMLITVYPAGLEQMFFEIGVPQAEGATIAPPPSEEDIHRLMAKAPNYGVQLRLPGHAEE